jgi:hypothetical protein
VVELEKGDNGPLLGQIASCAMHTFTANARSKAAWFTDDFRLFFIDWSLSA